MTKSEFDSLDVGDIFISPNEYEYRVMHLDRLTGNITRKNTERRGAGFSCHYSVQPVSKIYKSSIKSSGTPLTEIPTIQPEGNQHGTRRNIF